MALYPYQAQNEDELSFEKGDAITVLAKDEATWWKGELNGVSGVFPSNYVSPMCKYSFFCNSIFDLMNLTKNLFLSKHGYFNINHKYLYNSFKSTI